MKKEHGPGSAVMKQATSAANRTGSWSVAKQEFARKVAISGSFTDKSLTVRGDLKSQAGSSGKRVGHKS